MSVNEKPRKRERRSPPQSVEALIQLLGERGGELSYESLQPAKLRHSYFAASMLAVSRGLATWVETGDGFGGIKLSAAELPPSATDSPTHIPE